MVNSAIIGYGVRISIAPLEDGIRSTRICLAAKAASEPEEFKTL